MRLWRALQRRPLTPVRAGHGGRVNAHGRRDGGPGWSTATSGVGMTSSCSCSGSLRPWPVAARVLRRERRPRGAGEDVRRWVRAAAPHVSSGVLNCWLVLPLLNKKIQPVSGCHCFLNAFYTLYQRYWWSVKQSRRSWYAKNLIGNQRS